MKELTYEQAVQYLNEAVQLKGEDYIYQHHSRLDDEGNEIGPSCLYAHNGKPDCIVGHVLAKAGVPIELMEWSQATDESGGIQNPYSYDQAQSVLYRLHRDGLLYTGKATRKLLALAQSRQDQGSTWGQAVALAVRADEHEEL